MASQTWRGPAVAKGLEVVWGGKSPAAEGHAYLLLLRPARALRVGMSKLTSGPDDISGIPSSVDGCIPTPTGEVPMESVCQKDCIVLPTASEPLKVDGARDLAEREESLAVTGPTTPAKPGVEPPSSGLQVEPTSSVKKAKIVPMD
ncbi:unnamed protein product [Lampetra fluviatilis]